MLGSSWRLLGVALLVGPGLLLASCGKSPPGSGSKRFIFLINNPDPFWDACRAGLVEGAKKFELEQAGLSVTMEANDGTAQGQIDRLRQYASQSDIVGVAISVIQADNVAIIEEMKNLQAKGVQVVTVDGDVNTARFRDARPYYIGTNNVVAGRVLGTATKAVLEAKGVKQGGYVQFAGFTDNDNARNRMDGFKDGVGSAYTENDRMPDETSRTRAQDNVRNAIINHNDLVAIVGIWAYNGPAVAYVMNERKLRDKLTCVTFDADADSITQMSEGNIDCMCVQNPFEMGYVSVRLLKAMHQNDQATIKEMFPSSGQENGDIFTTGLRVVVPDHKSPIKPDLFDPKVVEFMTLSQLNDWLKKYNLKSS
jgi:ribose transport system substrate-binding protein